MNNNDLNIKFTNNVEVCEVRKAEFTKYVLSVLVKDGIRFIHIHEWYFKKSTKEWKPGMKSVTLPYEMPPMEGVPQHPARDFVDAFVKTMEIAKDIELDNPDNYIYDVPRKEKAKKKAKKEAAK